MRKLHILFVDSDPIGREKMQLALGDSFLLQYAATRSEAMRYLEEQIPDLLISEIAIGQESGLDLCRAIRTIPALQHLPIMLLTSLATFQDKVAGFDAGADDYVVKPFDMRHLTARIRLLARIKRIEWHDSEQ